MRTRNLEECPCCGSKCLEVLNWGGVCHSCSSFSDDLEHIDPSYMFESFGNNILERSFRSY